MSTEQSSPQEIAITHQKEILQYAASSFGYPETEFTLREEEAFFSDVDVSITFMLVHQTGVYAVNAEIDQNGELTNFTSADLQRSGVDMEDPGSNA